VVVGASKKIGGVQQLCGCCSPGHLLEMQQLQLLDAGHMVEHAALCGVLGTLFQAFNPASRRQQFWIAGLSLVCAASPACCCWYASAAQPVFCLQQSSSSGAHCY
jgi:hypothetical protein